MWGASDCLSAIFQAMLLGNICNRKEGGRMYLWPLSSFGESFVSLGVSSPTRLFCRYAHGVPQHLMAQQQQGKSKGNRRPKMLLVVPPLKMASPHGACHPCWAWPSTDRPRSWDRWGCVDQKWLLTRVWYALLPTECWGLGFGCHKPRPDGGESWSLVWLFLPTLPHVSSTFFFFFFKVLTHREIVISEKPSHFVPH